MLDLKNFQVAISQISEEKGISKEKVIETIEQAIAAAYKKEYCSKNSIIKGRMDPSTGEVKFWQVKIVVDEDMLKEEDEEESEENETKIRFNEERHIMLDEAKKINPDVSLEEEIIFPLEIKEEFGRIAAQTAKQVVLQRLREAERDAVLEDFRGKEGEIVGGIVQRVERGNVHINLGKAQGVMFYNESVPNERYRVGDRKKFYILSIQETYKGPMIVLSRRNPEFVKKLFELEIPEISTETVKIMGIAREAGFRSKVAVHSVVEGVDPIGSCVGQKGTRIMAILDELGNEKIDVIKWSDDPEDFASNALSPAKFSHTEIGKNNNIIIFVPEDQISLAIGKDGINVRLAVKLTDRKIDVRSEEKPDEILEGGVADPEELEKLEEKEEEKETGETEEKEEKEEKKKEKKEDKEKEKKDKKGKKGKKKDEEDDNNEEEIEEDNEEERNEE